MKRTRPGLAHAVFLSRHGDPRGQAAFLVLRVVDARARPEFRHQWHAADEFVRELAPDPDDEVANLRDILDAADSRDELESALAAYAMNRRDREYHDEAIDVLETAWRVVRGSPGELIAATRIGEYLVRARRLHEAAARYRTIGRSGLRDARLIARRGEADVLLAAGKPEQAERVYQRVLAAAQRAQYEAVALNAEVGIARALLFQGKARDATLAAWKLRPRFENLAQELLGPALEALGALDAAVRIQAPAAVGDPNLDRRWQSLAAVVRIATRQNDRLTFERWRKVGEEYHATGLPPISFELDFWLELARGAAWFEARELEKRAVEIARDLTSRASVADAGARFAAAVADLRERRPPAPIPPLAADPEIEPILTWADRFSAPAVFAAR